MAVCNFCGGEKVNGVCEACKAANKPFQAKYLEEEGKRQDVVAVRLNEAERAKLEEIKEMLDLPADSKVLKFLAFAGYNVLLATFGAEFTGYLCEENRPRLALGKRKKRDFFKDL